MESRSGGPGLWLRGQGPDTCPGPGSRPGCFPLRAGGRQEIPPAVAGVCPPRSGAEPRGGSRGLTGLLGLPFVPAQSEGAGVPTSSPGWWASPPHADGCSPVAEDSGASAQGWLQPPQGPACVTPGPQDSGAWVGLVQRQATAQDESGTAAAPGGPWGAPRQTEGVCVSWSLPGGSSPGGLWAQLPRWGPSEATFPGPSSPLCVVWLLGSAMWGTGGEGGSWGPTMVPPSVPWGWGWRRAQQSPRLSSWTLVRGSAGAEPALPPRPCQCCSLASSPPLPSSGFQNLPGLGVGEGVEAARPQVRGELWLLSSTGTPVPGILDPAGKLRAPLVRGCCWAGAHAPTARTGHGAGGLCGHGGGWWQLVHQDGFGVCAGEARISLPAQLASRGAAAGRREALHQGPTAPDRRAGGWEQAARSLLRSCPPAVPAGKGCLGVGGVPGAAST